MTIIFHNITVCVFLVQLGFRMMIIQFVILSFCIDLKKSKCLKWEWYRIENNVPHIRIYSTILSTVVRCFAMSRYITPNRPIVMHCIEWCRERCDDLFNMNLIVFTTQKLKIELEVFQWWNRWTNYLFPIFTFKKDYYWFRLIPFHII